MTESLQIAEKTAKRVQRDIEFVCRQLLRFAKMPLDERMAFLRKHPKDALCLIPHPSGKGNLLCGSLALKKFGEITDLALELDRGLGRRVGRQRAREAVINAFVKRVMKEVRDTSQETAELLLQDTLAALGESLVVTEHYVPCVLFPDGGPDEFNIGPVTFTRRKKFFKERKLTLKYSIEEETASHVMHVDALIAKGFPRERSGNEIESRKFIRILQARAIRAYRRHPWIARVRVTDCDKDTSQEHATRAVEMALHVIRILLGAEPMQKLRIAWSKTDPLKTAHLYADARGVIQASFCMNAFAPVGTKKWHEALMRCSSELVVFGSALTPIIDPVEIHHLHQRLIDAINWFGDAATNSNPRSSIVKYVSAIERLFFGKFEPGRTKLFAARVKVIFDAFGCGEGGGIHEKACAVYKTRSALVHGEYSPAEDKTFEMLRLAEEISRMSLLCSVQLYPMILQAFGSSDPARLEEVMKRIHSEGINWLAEAAGYKQIPSEGST